MDATVLVTGAEGFVGRNLCSTLSRLAGVTALKFDLRNTAEELADFCQRADFVFHLAGVNRPKDPNDFSSGNVGLTEAMLSLLRRSARKCPVVLCSSIQAALENPYGESKRRAEELVFAYGREVGAAVCVYRLPNVFGKWSRPNYNSAVATWCHNIARNLPIDVRDPNALLTLVYVDDVVSEFLSALAGRANRLASGYCEVPVTYTRKLGEITALLQAFRAERENRMVSDQAESFAKKLYATYLAFLPRDQFSYPLDMKTDARGSFTEFVKTADRGQVSVNISKPGITKGNHWHHTKVEKFLVVSGRGVIRFRAIQPLRDDAETAQVQSPIIEYPVSGEKLQVVDIPPGYTHSLENLGESDLVTVMWASELLDPNNPDTFYEKV